MTTSDYTSDIPYGYCHCGCGGKTKIATVTKTKDGWVKGEPVKYINYHGTKHNPKKRLDNFWSHVNKDGSIPEHCPELGQCWEWTASTNKQGYGNWRSNNKQDKAHRFSWQLHYDEIPDGLWVLHKCDNPKCVNPDHLFLGTRQDNIDDMHTKKRNNQPKGEKHNKAKLTPPQIIDIRNLYSAGKTSQYKLAKLYGVSRANIKMIVNRQTWKHLP